MAVRGRRNDVATRVGVSVMAAQEAIGRVVFSRLVYRIFGVARNHGAVLPPVGLASAAPVDCRRRFRRGSPVLEQPDPKDSPTGIPVTDTDTV